MLVVQQRLDHRVGDRSLPQDPTNALQAGPGNPADSVTDNNALSGFLLEKVVWNGLHSTEWAGTGNGI